MNDSEPWGYPGTHERQSAGLCTMILQTFRAFVWDTTPIWKREAAAPSSSVDSAPLVELTCAAAPPPHARPTSSIPSASWMRCTPSSLLGEAPLALTPPAASYATSKSAASATRPASHASLLSRPPQSLISRSARRRSVPTQQPATEQAHRQSKHQPHPLSRGQSERAQVPRSVNYLVLLGV